MHRASPINMAPSSFSIDQSSIWRLSIIIFSSTNFVLWVFAELVDIPASMKKHSQSLGVMNPVRSAMSNLWSCSHKYSVMKQSCQTRVLLEKEDYLSIIWLWTYGHIIAWAMTSDFAHSGTLLHGHYGSKCYYYSTLMFFVLLFLKRVFFCRQSFWILIGFKPIYLTHKDGTLTSTITPGQSGPESIGNETMHHTLQISWTGASSSDAV